MKPNVTLQRHKLQTTLAVFGRLRAAHEDGDRAAVDKELDLMEKRLLDLEDAIGVATPAALFDLPANR